MAITTVLLCFLGNTTTATTIVNLSHTEIQLPLNYAHLSLN